MANVVWTPCDVSPVAGELVATHEGVINIVGVAIRCYQLGCEVVADAHAAFSSYQSRAGM